MALRFLNRCGQRKGANVSQTNVTNRRDIGQPSYIVDQIGEYFDAGPEEIMFSGVPTKRENFDRIDSDVLSAFD